MLTKKIKLSVLVGGVNLKTEINPTVERESKNYEIFDFCMQLSNTGLYRHLDPIVTKLLNSPLKETETVWQLSQNIADLLESLNISFPQPPHQQVLTASTKRADCAEEDISFTPDVNGNETIINTFENKFSRGRNRSQGLLL